MNPIDADRKFFAALIAADARALERILTDDFILIDVMSGSENTKTAFIAFVGSGQIKFVSVEPAENRVRIYQGTAVITGRTQMKGLLGDVSFETSSRYTHVFILQQNEWRLASAQGTPISSSA